MGNPLSLPTEIVMVHGNTKVKQLSSPTLEPWIIPNLLRLYGTESIKKLLLSVLPEYSWPTNSPSGHTLYMKKLGSVNGEGYESIIWERTKGGVWFVGDGDIDADGGSNPNNDPDYQSDTTLHYNGKPIDAENVAGMVIPTWLVKAVKGIVHGCQGRVTNLDTQASYPCVVHDDGPKNKDGEITPYLARKLGINPNSISGGEDNPILMYEFWPGVPARVDGVTYNLQAST